MGYGKQFRTYQTVDYYEESLKRHGQWIRWTRVITCSCVNPVTGQPDLNHSLCKGRGEIYKVPGPFRIRQEQVPMDNHGKVYLKHVPYISGTAVIRAGGPAEAALSQELVQPSNSYVQLAWPFPMKQSRLRAEYLYDPVISVVDEDAEVLGNLVLRVNAGLFYNKGRPMRGSIDKVTRVYNVTKDYYYPVVLAQKEYILLQHMGENGGTWEPGDVLEVDYTYVMPFNFVIFGISPRRRYETAFVIDSADSTAMSPYWADIAPNDLLTAMSVEIPGFSIIDPNRSGPTGLDEVRDFYDVSRITDVIDKNGVEYNAQTSVQLFGRNNIKWLVTKPTVNYTVHFMYHPTFVGLVTHDMARNAENKSFINRINVMFKDRMNRGISF